MLEGLLDLVDPRIGGDPLDVGCSIFQSMPSRLNPAWRFMIRVVSSTRKTPAKPSPNGTTAELKMLFDRSIWSRLMIGLRLDRHSTALEPAGRSSQGMFGSASVAAVPIRGIPAAGRAC